jgi:hypothetical protein
MAVVKFSDIGVRGLVVCDREGQYRYVAEATWRKDGKVYPATESTKALQKLQAVVAPLDRAVVFLNLDELPGAPPATSTDKSGRTRAAGESRGPWSIVVSETDSKGTTELTEVSSELSAPLDPGAEGDAGVLVRRGAVVAAIPKNSIPSGSFCVLVNLRGIKFPA